MEFNFEKWQKIIINWLAQLENESQFLNWVSIMKELNIHEKCDMPLRNNLKDWYRSYSNNKKFPPQPVNLPQELLFKGSGSATKTKTVYDQNKNKVQIVLPPNLKSNNLFFKEKQQEILEYLKSDQDPPPNWTQVSQKLGYNYKYTLEARKPLKEWYTQYYKELLEKWNQQNLGTNDYNGFSNTKNVSSKESKKIDFDEKNSIEQLLISMFDKIKEMSLTYKEPQLIKYYNDFLEHFTPNVLKNYGIFHNYEGKKIIDGFSNVSNLKEFKHYLESSPGLYPKLALWAIENPFPIKVFQIMHHLMPEFLQNYQFNRKQLNQSYNLVRINRIIHYFMHLVRLIEYAQPEDNHAVELMLRNQASNTAISWGSNSLQNTVKIMYDSLNSEMLKNYPKYEKEIMEKRKKQILELNSKKMSEKTKEVLTKKRVWRHTDNDFEYVQQPQDPPNCSMNDFTLVFIQAYTEYQKYHNEPLFFDEKTNIESTREMFSKYCRGYSSVVYKFYIVDPPDFIKPL